ncbi:MAG: hypothetical protein F2667_12830 [Actinobacteria bacterium]|uniref:Unannotated protein n=1 Tax=freshwater metagenome TaxID=449393 RepID=A0A6J6S1T1_9ZZZZ|nr:hypothetical protein [Actinomycetota bacterium]
MHPRAFLVRGLLVGLLAGIATFVVAHQVGEPHVERAIALEEAGAAVPADGDHAHHEEAGAGHSHGADEEDGGTVVPRATQRTWGLLTGAVAVGVALGAIVALVSAAAVGRLGSLSAGASTAVVSLVGFVSTALVPFLKYPATPPAVGSGDTIGARTEQYFAFVAVSVVAAALATVLARRLLPRLGAYGAVISGTAAYVAVVVVVGLAMPTVNEVGAFPADTLWYFRRASLLTLATLWAGIGIGLTGLLGQLGQRERAAVERRELAASL